MILKTSAFRYAALFLFAAFILIQAVSSQTQPEKKEPGLFAGLEFRSIGPAFMSGRIADIAINPKNESQWYVAVGSGGVWKTNNAGTTWEPLFDEQPSYSTGCITIDPSNPNVIWVGTGENVGGRHVGYGDGIYRSADGGRSWKNMGLKESRHISKIIIHPENPDILWVAAQGPLWNKGGERGLYKSTDGGKSWKKTLGDDEWTGVTDIVTDPRNPDFLYAATWERYRNVAVYQGGGPGSGIHRSFDGGETWEELSNGLPKSDMGKIGLAISPQKPDVIYAAIELDRRTGGVFRSSDRGASWTKMSETVSGATGPHYYQELYACPHHFDKIYLADVRMQISMDGGKSFKRMKEENKHSDNHAIAFRANDPDYLLVGTDGGLYESYDLTENWRFINNLPLTQFYKLALDDAEPFYTIYGGTQDNCTQGGPSRTDNAHGIRNDDWEITLFGDGHQPATEPGNPDIMYSEAQEGHLFRVDRTTGEVIFIQPQPAAGEGFERYNWDAPILVSPHSPTRLYFASQRVWRSENRGDSWIAISGDLTRYKERFTLPIGDKTWSWDSPWDINAMSTYNTITSIAESPLEEGLLYIGTDDGLIQVSEDGGGNWSMLEVSDLPGVPGSAFVNDIKAGLFDKNTVYIVLDNHKFGDLEPYLLKSTDRGKSWTSIRANIPSGTLVWRIVQDHVDPELLFCATEFGIYCTMDGGDKWHKLNGGIPTISFRDIAIQRRENDLVGASFGRGFYVLDDYSVLRDIDQERLNEEASLFKPRKAWWYIEQHHIGRQKKGSQGASYYAAPNPPFGAVFTYYLKDGYKTAEDIRRESEKKLKEDGSDIEFPGWEAVENERREYEPVIWLIVKDKDGNTVRRISGPASKGFHRIAWDLRYPAVTPVGVKATYSEKEPKGFMAAPGEYNVSIYKDVDGVITLLSGPVSFEVVPLYESALPGASPEKTAANWQEVASVQRSISAAKKALKNAIIKTNNMKVVLKRTPAAPGKLDSTLHNIHQDLLALDEILNGNRSKLQVGEKTEPTITSRMQYLLQATRNTTYGSTPGMLQQMDIINIEFDIFKSKLYDILEVRIPTLQKAMQEAGAPWMDGQSIPE